MYVVKRDGKLWQVLDSRGVVQFSSLVRKNCTEWVRANALG